MNGPAGPEPWRLPVDRSAAPKREPGPIDLRRSLVQPAYSGLPTFMGVPVCLDQEDLRAGQAEVVVLGVPLDTSTGHRGAAYGPRGIRSDERYLFQTPELMVHPATRVSPFHVLRVVDYGDAPVDIFSLENSLPSIAGMVGEIAEVGAVPVLLGGDHTLMIASLGELADRYGPDQVGLVHLDAHPDCHEHILGTRVTHGTPIWRLIEDKGIPGRNVVQVGLRTPSGPDDTLFNWMRRNGLRTHFMTEIDRLGLPAVIDKVIEELRDGPEFVYLSLDIDVLDPAYAPGTGTPEPGGLTPRELFPALRRICAETNVIGIDVVEVAPHLDPGYITTMNARRCVFESITGLAMRKLGITSPDYTNPVVSGRVTFPLTGR